MTSPPTLFDTTRLILSSPLVPLNVYVAASDTPAVINKASAMVVNNITRRLIEATSLSEGGPRQPRLKLTNAATLASSDESSVNSCRNFVELRLCELRRIYLLRCWVHKDHHPCLSLLVNEEHALAIPVHLDLTRSGGHPRVWRQSLRGGSPYAEEDRVTLHEGVQGRGRSVGPLLSREIHPPTRLRARHRGPDAP